MPNRRKRKGNGSPSDSISAMSGCNLPEDLIVEILSRLPVKSLLRFKSVSKPWLALIKNPKFISLHFNSTAMNPRNDTVIIHSLSLRQDNIMSLFNVNSIVNKPINLDHPFPEFLRRMDLVGSYNGLVCLYWPRLGQMIILWNPAMRLYKVIELSSSNEDSDDVFKISVGFGFDPVANDCKIVKIINLDPKPPKERIRVKVEVYSAKKDSWKMIQVETPFLIVQSRCNAILKGIPHWTGFIIDEDGVCGLREVLVYFDPQNEVFRLWPLPEYPGVIISRVTELRNGFALLVYSSGEKSCKYVDVLVQYDSKEGLVKRIGPIPFKVVRLIECSKNGEILAESTEGKLFLYDPKTNRVRDILIDDAQALSYEAFSYTESLVSIEGMKQVGMEP